MSDKDRRLVLVVQGDREDTVATMWLETPCDDHEHHVLRKQLSGLPARPQESPQNWLLDVLGYVKAELCLCDAENLGQDVVTRILEATRG